MKKYKIILTSTLTLCLFLLMGASCQKEAAPQATKQEAVKEQAAWTLENPEFKATLDFSNSNEGELAIEKKSDNELSDFQIYDIEKETGDKKELEVKEKKTVVFPGSTPPEDSSLIGMSAAGTDYGLFMSAAMMGMVPNPLYPPDNHSTIRPTSGIWEFNMQADAGNLSGPECPSGIGGFSSSGEATLNVSGNGLSAVLDIDGQIVSFVRPDPNDTLYDSYDMSFPTMDKEDNPTTGTVRFTFIAADQDKIENGVLHWDNNQGCTGTYPFTLDLVSATENPPYVPAQGTWQVEAGPVFCGASPDLSAFLNLPSGTGNLAVTGGGPSPMLLNLSLSSMPLTMIQEDNSNFYSVFPGNIYLGNYFDPITSMNISYNGTFFNFMAASETSLTGMVLITGTNGCSSVVPLNLTHL